MKWSCWSSILQFTPCLVLCCYASTRNTLYYRKLLTPSCGLTDIALQNSMWNYFPHFQVRGFLPPYSPVSVPISRVAVLIFCLSGCQHVRALHSSVIVSFLWQASMVERWNIISTCKEKKGFMETAKTDSKKMLSVTFWCRLIPKLDILNKESSWVKQIFQQGNAANMTNKYKVRQKGEVLTRKVKNQC